jgi:hypothetical protein
MMLVSNLSRKKRIRAAVGSRVPSLMSRRTDSGCRCAMWPTISLMAGATSISRAPPAV